MHILQLDGADPRAQELVEILKKGDFNVDIRADDVDLKLDDTTHTVTRNGREIPLTKKEFSLVSILYKNKNETVSRETIIRDVWGMTIDPFSNTIEAHVRSLRKKLGEPNIIQTIPREGYKLSGRS